MAWAPEWAPLRLNFCFAATAHSYNFDKGVEDLCRDRARGESAVNAIKATGNVDVQLLLCDLSSQVAIRRAVKEFCGRFDRLHVLINNAAMYTSARVVTEDGFEMQFAVNYFAPFLLTNLLVNTLKASAPARIINVSTVNYFDVALDLHDLQVHHLYIRTRAMSPEVDGVSKKYFENCKKDSA